MKIDAVFEGGGMRGIGILGAINCIEHHGYEFQRVAGTSAGAVIAALIAAGYSALQIRKLLLEISFLKFMDKDKLQRLPILGKPLGIIKEKGLYSGDYLQNFMDNLLKHKGISKFKDVCVNGEYKLKIIASDITNKKSIVIPSDLANYGIDPMEFSIAKAVRMSCCIPFYFKPVQLLTPSGIAYIVDGGVTCNFPLTIFDVNSIPRWPTIGFRFNIADDNKNILKANDSFSFLIAVAQTMCKKNTSEYLNEENLIRSVIIPTYGIAPTDFNLSKATAIHLYKSGYISAKKFLENWDFQDYINKYRYN
ncbi:patatin-like phospholipase family protein [Clostridium sp. CF012]|uniref:patatin-like phospholipase family protein n=1 Tax=Clostridium sp. CF012 TaxID=2843319 RepID=UPI001C0E168B|nr:patatin-like phospholipase family protein [Clostridium sp. CF012]MBU3143024.1 patatin-like phospholipase family protein [Clostridium sp. CF012]